MAISELINGAIQTRQKYQKKLEDYKADLQEWSRYVSALSGFIGNTRWMNIINDNSQQTAQKWETIVSDITSLKATLQDLGFCGAAEGSFVRALTRVSRGYVNLGIVGTFRQGKSTLMRQLIQTEEFDNSYLFPVKGGNDACTGAPVNYINALYESVDQDGNVSRYPAAVVRYYTSSEMCKLIEDYIRECRLDGAEWERITNKTKEGLRNYCVSHRSKATNMQDALPNTLRATLKSLILRGCDDNCYIDLLDSPETPIPLNTHEGRTKYMKSISFFDSLQANINNRIYLVYATKDADVYVKFNLNGEDVGCIRFLDTPGTGEKRLGVSSGLGEKMQNDLDLVIAINKLDEGTQNDEAVNDFHNILKNKFDCDCDINGIKFYSSQFIYYIINCALEDMSLQQNAQLLYSRYKRLFKDGLEAIPHPINLPENHKVIINCNDDQYFDYDVDASNQIITTTLNVQKNSQTFLYDAISHLSSTIGLIDEYFAHDAVVKYKQAKEQKNNLDEHIKEFILPQQFQLGNWVGKKMKKIWSELKSYSAKTDITKAIGENIESFASLETLGSEVMKLFELPLIDETEIETKKIIEDVSHIEELKDEEKQELIRDRLREILLQKLKQEIRSENNNYNYSNDDDEFLDNLSEKIVDEIEKSGSDFCNTFDGLGEFEEYSARKIVFYKQFGSDIKKLIDDTEALKTIKETKRNIFTYLKGNEILGFVSQQDAEWEDWYNELINKFNEEGRSILAEAFSLLYEFDLNVAEQIDDHILSAIKPKFHKDKFDGQMYDNATMVRIAFVRSFLNIELMVKEYLNAKEQSQIESLRQSCNDKFKDRLNDFAEIAHATNDEKISSDKYEQLRDFLLTHSDEILERSGDVNEEMMRQGLIDKWYGLTKGDKKS